jgi:UDP-N-acetylmuramate dehydrogenase
VKEVKNIQEIIDKLGISHKRNFELSKRSPMKAGGTCDYFFEPNSKEQLVELIKGLRQIHKEFIVVGFMSNVIFRGGRIRTPIIFTGKLKTFRLEVDDRVHVDAGCSLSFVANELTQKGFKGFSGLSGFPATIGGAIFMNASCYGNSISDHLDYVECIDKEGSLIRF